MPSRAGDCQAMGCPGHPQVEGLGECQAWAVQEAGAGVMDAPRELSHLHRR